MDVTRPTDETMDCEQLLRDLNTIIASVSIYREQDIAEILLGELETARRTLSLYAGRQCRSLSRRNHRTPQKRDWLGWLPLPWSQHPTRALNAREQTACAQSAVSAVEPETLRGSQLEVFLLGGFQAFQDNNAITKWPNSKGRQVFEYLVLHRKERINKEVLMDLFWPNLPPKSARNNLNVNICGLRRTLPKPLSGYSHIVYEADCYFINPMIDIWVDLEVMEEALKQGKAALRRNDESAAVRAFQTATSLYKGELLAEERYEDWLQPIRRKCEADCLDALRYLRDRHFRDGALRDVVGVCQKIAGIDLLDQQSLRCLMYCYQRIGSPHLAIREYHQYAKQLRNEYDLPPNAVLRQTLLDIKGGRAVQYSA